MRVQVPYKNWWPCQIDDHSRITHCDTCENGRYYADKIAALEDENAALHEALGRIGSGESVLVGPGVLDDSFSGRTAREMAKIACAALASKDKP